MQLISATDLRRNTKKLFKALEEGKTVSLVKGSKIVAEIKPKKEKSGKVFNANRFLQNTEGLNLPILTDEEINKRYREEMERKHGQSVS